jgi:alpha-tubulin suppressor-like RCC1 family protein
VTADGALHCWGGDTYGELGNGEPLSASQTPIEVALGADAVDVDAGDNDTCAITSNGAALCWGKNADGQLGNGESGTQVMSSTPQAVVGLDAGVTSISAGYSYTCAVASAAMLCWGDNFDGTLGNGEGPGYESPVPIAVSGLGSGAAQIGACSGHACGRTDAGAVWCWGTNDGGALGDGTTDSSTVPVEVLSLP